MKRFRTLSMEGVGLALRSVIARVKDATAKRPSVSVEVRIKYKTILHLNPKSSYMRFLTVFELFIASITFYTI